MGTIYGSEEICSVYREDPSKFIEDILKVHNQYRAIHGSPPLQIDEKLNERAQQLAKSLSKNGEDALKEAYIPYGENVYVRHPLWRMLPEEPVQYWYQESRYYNYDAPRPRNLKYVRNFTQLVWKDSKWMGIGIVTGWNGKVYLVCSYDPAANIDGDFQRNVLPPREKDVSAPSEELELEFAEPSVEVVRSMERLYAVPSEKLRVWMVWLTGVGEIADEWHKWLRANIDLITRIAERLQMVANNVPGGSGKIESVTNVKSEEILDNAMSKEKEEKDVPSNALNATKGNSFVTGLEEPGIINEASNGTLSAAKVSLKERVDESSEATAIESSANEENSSTSQTHNNPINASAGRIGGGGERESTMTTTTMAADASETAERTTTVWPIGTRWQPLTRCPPIEKKADQMETIRSLKMPQTEIERTEFLKNFTHQATLFGSYYKHWIETADQAVKEIAGRTVMTTAKFRGTDDSDSMLDVAASQAAQYSMKELESAVAQPIEGTMAATAETPMPSRIDPPTTDALGRDTDETSIALSDDQSKVVEPSTKKETAGMEAESPSAELDAAESPSAELDAAESPSAELDAAESPSAELDAAESPSAEPDAASPSVEPDATSLQPETTSKMWPTMEPAIVSTPPSKIAETLSQEAVAKRKAAEKLLRDMARAEENIPYFFYLKAEPDMDIAIRYNDEKVIPPDLDRESISVDRKHLYFNLTDKPGRDW
ncbi:uncharacterized protein [Anoplolepis gracilipes]|uniref:uncharacterized protein n=1 Tax=Anoplolepis gracilipes TaxID=354296 RepID=UPI003B9ED60E